MERLQKILLVITIIGAINWGLIGLLNINLVETIFGLGMISNIIYILVGVAGLINIGILFNHIEEVKWRFIRRFFVSSVDKLCLKWYYII